MLTGFGNVRIMSSGVDVSPGLRGREAGPSSVWLLLWNVLQSLGSASAGAKVNRHIWSN